MPNNKLPLPCIAGIRLGGAGHFIAILPADGNRCFVADPLSGGFFYERSSISENFDFSGFFMEIVKESEANDSI